MQTIRPSRSFTRSDFDSETFCVASIYFPVPIPMVVWDDQARIEQYWAQMADGGSPIQCQRGAMSSSHPWMLWTLFLIWYNMGGSTVYGLWFTLVVILWYGISTWLGKLMGLRGLNIAISWRYKRTFILKSGWYGSEWVNRQQHFD